MKLQVGITWTAAGPIYYSYFPFNAVGKTSVKQKQASELQTPSFKASFHSHLRWTLSFGLLGFIDYTEFQCDPVVQYMEDFWHNSSVYVQPDLWQMQRNLSWVSVLWEGKRRKKKTVIRETEKEALTGNERVGVIVFSMRHVHMCALCLCRMHGRQKISQRWIYTGENKKLGFHKQASDLLAGLERCVLTMRCYVSRGNSRSLKKALGIWAAVDSSLGLWCAHRSVVHPINSFVLQVWLRSYKLTCTFSQNTLLEGCNIHLILIKYSTMSIHSILTKCMI